MKNIEQIGWSDLEREVELEMDEPLANRDDTDLSTQLEASEPDEEADEDFESSDLDRESSDDPSTADPHFAERFYELSTRQFESDIEADTEVNRVLYEMERDYFFGRLKKALKKGVKWGAKQLVQKGLKYAGNLPAVQALQGATQLARGNLRGMLGSLAKAGLSSAVPGMAFLPQLRSLGFQPGGGDEQTNQDAWRNYAAMAQQAYANLANNIDQNSDQAVEASRQAGDAFQSALNEVQNVRSGEAGKKIYRIRVRKGERVKIIIEGI